jgi:hypothetical protein
MDSKLTVPKGYFQDKAVLLLLGVNSFLAFLDILLIILRLVGRSGSTLIVQYRAGTQIGAFQSGSTKDILYFALFVFLVVAFHAVLSIRVYAVKRQLAITALSFSVVLLVVAAIVSNALISLH